MGAGPGSTDWVTPVKALVKHRGLPLSRSFIAKVLADIDRHAPWFAASGDLNLACWEKLGKDLERAKQLGKIGRGTMAMWNLIRQCLRDDSSEELIDQGRKVLWEHQDSLSETDAAEGDDRENKIEKGKEKTSKKLVTWQKEKVRDSAESSVKKLEPLGNKVPQKTGGRDPPKRKSSSKLYPDLQKELADLNLEEEESLSEEEEADLEEEAAKYESERYGPPPPYAGVPPSAPPPSCGGNSGQGCHFLTPRTRSQLASAYPVLQDAQGQRSHEPVPYKQLKDLVEATRTYGVTASYTRALLSRLATQAMTPSDWFEIARACLTTGQYLDFKSLVTDGAQAQARVNVQQGNQHWTADMLLGQG